MHFALCDWEFACMLAVQSWSFVSASKANSLSSAAAEASRSLEHDWLLVSDKQVICRVGLETAFAHSWCTVWVMTSSCDMGEGAWCMSQ